MKIQKIIKKILLISLLTLPVLSFATNVHSVQTGTSITNITNTSATVFGSANPNGIWTAGYFKYSTAVIPPIFCNDNFGSNEKSTNEVVLVPEYTTKNWNTTINGLTPNTTYYFCAVASDKNVIEYGQVESFTTFPSLNSGTSSESSLSSIETKPATNVGANSAHLNGYYNSAVNSETWFEYRQKLTYEDLKNIKITEIKSASISGTSVAKNTNTVTGINSSFTTAQTTPSASAITSPSQTAKQKGIYDWSGKVSSEIHPAGSSGEINFFLKNLQSNKRYEFRAVLQTNISGKDPVVSYGNIQTFTTTNSGSDNGDVPHTNSKTNNTNNNGNLNLGQETDPPVDAIVRYHEGVEHVFVRQIMKNSDLAEMYGYQQGSDLNAFAWYLADFLARTFGYVSPSGKEIRVSYPDRAAYQLKLVNGNLTVYEYFDSKIISVQTVSSVLKGKLYYEYYFNKR